MRRTKAERISVVVGAMKRHPVVQQNPCWVLASITDTVVENKNKEGGTEAGGVALIVDAMKQYASEPFLPSCGCLALAHTNDCDTNKPSIVEQNGINVVRKDTSRMPRFSLMPVKL